MKNTSNKVVHLIHRKPKYEKVKLKTGAWKLAYADFVTAMMCFFMLMWLLNAVPSEKLKDVAMYFKPTFGFISKSEEDSDNTTKKTKKDNQEKIYDNNVVSSISSDLDVDVDQVFASLQTQITNDIQQDITLKNYAPNLSFNRNSDGLEISILDNNKGKMFKRGSAELTDEAKEVLMTVSQAIKYIPNLIAISGYTEKSNSMSLNGYSKWDLSAARANEARRVLQIAGVPEERIAKIVAYGDNALLMKDDPYSPRNRRVSITLMTKFDSIQYRVPLSNSQK
jgi:chemotaxis protein MotB